MSNLQLDFPYLQKIQKSEKSFEQEVNQLNLNVGAIINSNYWRINGINNVYTVFQSELKEKFGKDVTPKEEKVEVPAEVVEKSEEVTPKKRGRKKKNIQEQDIEDSKNNEEESETKKSNKTSKKSDKEVKEEKEGKDGKATKKNKESKKDKEEFNLYKLQEFSEGEQTKDHHKNLLDESIDNLNDLDDLDDYDDLFDDLDDDELYEDYLDEDELLDDDYDEDFDEDLFQIFRHVAGCRPAVPGGGAGDYLPAGAALGGGGALPCGRKPGGGGDCGEHQAG